MSPPAVAARFAGALVLLAAGCGDDPPLSPPPRPDASIGCAPGTSADDRGQCRPAGIPEGECGAGFESAGDRGCRAILPATPCADGTFAVPGDSECHPLDACADGTWGDIPIEPDTELVDAAAAPGGDGSARKPYSTIQAAIDAAARGALVAVANGSYAEDLVVDKPLRLRGRCAASVEVVGQAADGAIAVGPEGSGAEISDLSVRGPQKGLTVSGANDVRIERVRVHDTGYFGVHVKYLEGDASATLAGVLVERVQAVGVNVTGATATVESSVVRDVQPLGVDADKFGWGLAAVADDQGHRGSLALRGSLTERVRDLGVLVLASSATIEATLVRDVSASAADATRGWGIAAQGKGGQGANLSLKKSVVERVVDIGVTVFGSEAELESVVISATQPSAADRTKGWAASVQPQDGIRGKLTLTTSLLDASHDVGLVTFGADVTLERSLTRDTQPDAVEQAGGRGLDFQDDPTTHERTNAIVRSSEIATSHEAGVLVYDSDLVLEASAISDTQAATDSGLLGDGLVVLSAAADANANVTGSSVSRSARVGISAFGGRVTLGTTTLECNPIHLNGEPVAHGDYAFADTGGNVCGCSGASVACKVLTSGLAPPKPLEP